ncbi:transcriptional regulator, TetR family [Quadrisphaera granulorum]|uniref:TetR family transcriptional regulator n=1 Tax=Quadrisphaera granulorum TaxID=317664 RepID=A0A316AA07_9ACTN|nr:TetR/AcrR family transcriptional regulator C-terminal domain-containing protein [Quadrisphaera granulorum]PWJ54239.1 TetR family transcriptional regulator [Quadrisphaera granulorum]SZE96378.1 transcriptional regulator, TetR family [Quadrisphaera granulorum]
MPPARAGNRHRPGRGSDALSRDVVVDAAVALLDELGERGFTVRLLVERLETGPGAVYWHVANKDELVALAADRVLASALSSPASSATEGGQGEGDMAPVKALRRLAVAVYDALDVHPWAGPQVTASPVLPSALALFDRVGGLLVRAGVPAHRRFTLATVVFTHVLAVSAQMTARAEAGGERVDRQAFLERSAARLEQLAGSHPFLADVAGDMRHHDDREQFLVGLDLLLSGLAAELAESPELIE